MCGVADAAWLCCLVVVCAADVMLISTSLICTVDAARVCMPSVVPRRRAQRPRPVHWAGRVATAIRLVLIGCPHGRMALDGFAAVSFCAFGAGAASIVITCCCAAVAYVTNVFAAISNSRSGGSSSGGLFTPYVLLLLFEGVRRRRCVAKHPAEPCGLMCGARFCVSFMLCFKERP